MGFSLKEFSELHFNLKATIIGFVLIAPIWYLNIFLFHPNFYNAYPFYISLLFSYCLTMAWLISNIIIVNNIKPTPPSSFATSIGIALPKLLFFTGIAYYFDWTIFRYIKIAFITEAVFITLILLSFSKRKKPTQD